MTAHSSEIAEKFRRAVVLLQMLLNLDGCEEWFAAEEEAREQLKAWGIKVPEPHDPELGDDE